MKAYLLAPNRLRIRGENDQSFKDVLKLWTELGGDVKVAPTGSMDLIGRPARFWQLAEKISADSRLYPVSDLIMSRLENIEVKTWDVPMPRADTLIVTDRPLIMGIINVTPDSFSDGGVNFDHGTAIENALRMADSGADILDIGGESTRPGAAPVSAEEEIRRVIPVIKGLVGKVSAPISIDTRKSKVAQAALEAGASIVNDVTMLTHDPSLADTAARYGAPLILSHIKGTPATMQQDPQYEDLWPEILDALQAAMEEADRRGVSNDSIILDPGIGFGKNIIHNLAIINGLFALTTLGRPILIGPSRKRFIGEILDVEPEQRLEGTIAACIAAYMRGAKIFRVHDVLENRRALDVTYAIMAEGNGI